LSQWRDVAHGGPKNLRIGVGIGIDVGGGAAGGVAMDGSLFGHE
jgi:hypothetical protein